MKLGRQLRRLPRLPGVRLAPVDIDPAGACAAAAAFLLMVSSGYAYSAPPATHAVTIEALRYSPSTIEVNKGDTVVWRNEDPFPHTVTAQNRAFDSGQIAEGKSWKFKARQSGEFTYICTLHPTMKGTLIVK